MTPIARADAPAPIAGDMSFHDVATVNFQGVVVAFARATPVPSGVPEALAAMVPTDIHFNVLALDVQSGNDAMDWSGFEKLELPDAVRPAGMHIINVPTKYDPSRPIDGLEDAGQPFRVLTNQEYIYLFRQAKKGTLLVNRLRLVRSTSPDNPQDVRYSLAPAWEVRFQRSAKPDTPADDKDIPSYLSTDKEPFIEPAIELFMIEGLTDGNFDVAFLPRNEGAQLTLEVFVARAAAGAVDAYSVPMDANGLFLLSGKTFVNQRIPPDFSFTLTDEHGAALPIGGRPSAAFYLKQERVRTAGSDTFMVKRSGRLLLGLAGGQPKTLVTVDFGAAGDGTLAQPAQTLKAGPVGVANYTLEFGTGAYVKLPSWTLGFAFSTDFWIYPTSLDVDPQLILGSETGGPSAPFIRLRSGTSIEVGFTGANGQTVTAQTRIGSIRQLAWSQVRVSVDAAAAPAIRFVIEINGVVVPCTIAGSGDTPGPQPIDVVGAPSAAGFIGSIDRLITYDAALWNPLSIVGEWAFDTIDYTDEHQAPLDPPITPNAKSPANPGKVFGAHLIPSTSPTASSSGDLSWDARGLTIYTAYFKDLSAYGELSSSPFLLAGSDGRIHCYFRGSSDTFSVMQLDTEVARATFDVPWQTKAGAAASGSMQIVAAQPGRFMNDATVTVSPAAAPAPAGFCSVVLASPSGRTERWSGVPRSLLPFASVLAGEGIDDPSDTRVQSGQSVYFDAASRRPAAYVPVAGNAAEAMLGFISEQPDDMPLASVAVTPAAPGLLTVALRHTTPRWKDTEIEQTWQDVPEPIDRFVETLRGLSPVYDYRGKGSSNVLSYSLSAFSELAAANRVVLFMAPTVTKATRIAVGDGSTPETCVVLIELDEGGERLTATWTEVPRAQQLFAATLEGVNSHYDYARHASGDYATIGPLLVVTTNGSTAIVENATLDSVGGAVVPDADLRVSASLFELVVTAPTQPSETAPTTSAPVAAARLQSAAFTNGGQPQPIVGGSSLFRAMPSSVPSSGAAGLVADTSTIPGGKAALTLQGFDGGWLNQPDERTLTFNWDNWVQFETDEAKAPNISALTMQGDMSVELWCRPTKSRGNVFEPHQRLLTFARTPTLSEGGDPVRYLAGLRDAPSLQCDKGTTIRNGLGTSDGTFYLWFNPSAAPGAPATVATGVIGSIATLGLTTPVLVTSIASDQQIHVDFALEKDATPIVGQAVVAPDVWSQIAVTFATTVTGRSTLTYHFAVQLFVNGALQGSQTYQTTRSSFDPITLAEMVIGDVVPGSPRTLPMTINEVALFDRPLADDEVERYADERVPDNADGLTIKWMLLEGDGNRAVNTAPTGATYDADISPIAVWQDDGLYSLPILGHGENIAVLRREPVIHGWAHLALVHQAGYALHLNRRDYADCGREDTLNLGDTCALEAWVQPDTAAGRTAQCVLAKGDEYELSISSTGRPQFLAKVEIGTNEQMLSVVGPDPLPTAGASYLAVDYQLVTVSVTEGQAEKPKYEVHIDLYVNGQRVAWGIQDPDRPGSYKRFDDAPKRVFSKARLNLGRSPQLNGSRYLRGYLADVRLWNRVLSASEVAKVAANRRMPGNSDGLISYWRFAEADGRTAFDSEGQSHAKLSRGDLRVNYLPTAFNTFYVGGREAEPEFADGPAAVGGYGTEPQFAFGQIVAPNRTGFYGQIDDVRIWNTQLTGEQIADSMHAPLSGAERGLRGYWNFDNGSGPAVQDNTGRGNDGALVAAINAALPQWTVSTAPLADEAPAVFNILGGVPTFEQIDITDTPSVVEYADLQRDAYGRVFSVMKRAYVSVDNGAISLITGFKIGDLDTVYLGQAQSKPSLIGFVEGAPPVPSENQTLPYWLGGYGEIHAYAGAASVQFQEADSTVYAFNADRDTSDTHTFTIKGGLAIAGRWGVSTGFMVEVENPIAEAEAHLGLQSGVEDVTHRSSGIGMQTGTNRTFATALSPGGAWEAGTKPEEWVNPTVGRRFVPNNTGLAVVKSLTVDVYASIIRATGAMVKVSMTPNPDIPEDINLIDFPINPRYVKNGTLDGKVGLANDPDYPDADLRRGSYFRPLEAYAIKRRIERADAQLEAYYQQYDQNSYSSKLKNEDNWKSFQSTSRDAKGYDWAQHLAKRSIVNTYVWTAGGGTYAEQMQPMNVYSESHGAIASRTGSIGAVGDVQMTFPVGFYTDFDYLYSSATEVNVVKSKEEGASFDLAASVSPETYLYAPRIGADDKVTFPNAPTEGKVDGYRYMAIFAAPDTDHADTFFTEVVDRHWLQNSRDANAAALREATSAANGPWRVLYRVTYVSRIPPRFQPVPAETLAPNVEPPANLAYNALIVQLVRDEIGPARPTPLAIGTAIATVIGTADAPGLLKASLPWWPELLRDSTDYRLSAGKILRALREDLLQYMLDDYATREADTAPPEARADDAAAYATAAAAHAMEVV